MLSPVNCIVNRSGHFLLCACLYLSLPGYLFDLFLYKFGIANVCLFFQNEGFVKTVYQRYPSGQVHLHDLFRRHFFQEQDQYPQRIPVGGNQHPFSVLHPGQDLLLKIWHRPGDGIRQAFSQGQELPVFPPVGRLQGRVPLIFPSQHRRPHIIMSHQDMGTKKLADRLGKKSNVISERLTQDNISIVKLNEMLQVLDYKIVIMPQEARVPAGSYVVEKTK